MWRRLCATVLLAASATALAERAASGQAGVPPADPLHPHRHQAAPVDDLARPGGLGLEQLSTEEQSAGRPWSITRSAGAVCFEVRQGERRDQERERDRAIERSEISVRDRLRFDVDYKIHYDFMVEPGPPDQAAWVNIGQLHSTPDPDDVRGLGPVFAVQFDHERMRVVARADAQKASASRPPDMWLYTDQTDLARGRWYRLDITLRIAPNGGGRLAVWRDGRQLVNYSGPLGYNDAVGPYWKLGIYRKSSPEPLTVCYRGFTLGEASRPAEASR